LFIGLSPDWEVVGLLRVDGSFVHGHAHPSEQKAAKEAAHKTGCVVLRDGAENEKEDAGGSNGALHD
jgi:hypothetical protein